MTLPPSLQPLGLYRQWITYRLVPHPTKPGKTDKIPCSWRTGGDVDLMKAVNYGSYEEAAAGAHLANVGHGSGVGFVFTDADPFWFLDIDGAFTADGKWSVIAHALWNDLHPAAWEISQSGKGLHAIGSGPVPDHGTRNTPLGLELYHTKRFVALTLRTINEGSADTVVPAIADVAAIYFPSLSAGPVEDWTTEAVPEWSGPEDDDELIKMALAARSAAAALGGGVTFTDLWEARDGPLAAKWPPDGHGAYNASHADAALASHLAFWTGKNCERIERLMRRSALVREKWDRNSPYLSITIPRACAAVNKVLRVSAAPTIPEDAAKALATGQEWGGYIPPASYGAYFSGAVYVIAHNQIFTPGHGLVGSTAFDTIYGGRKFIKDGEGRATSITASAWDAFRMCEMWRPPIANDICFRPEHPTAALVNMEDRLLVNTYAPILTSRLDGDPAPFFEFLTKLMPIERDRNIMLSYMAGIVQNPGIKVQWWPVVQGVEGNGKTMLLSIMAHAIGHRYTHLVNPDAMAKTGGQFNKWVQGNLFCGLEEIYVAKRRDFLESFKTTVTNDRIALEGKGADQLTGDNRCNGIMLTNHKDGVPIGTDTRRYAVFFTAQQTESDLERDGMMGDYFPRLWDWLRAEGFAIVNNWLQTWAPIAEFNPAGVGPARARAPKTSCHADVLRESLGNAEQEVIEAIEQGQTGFRGGWVSSHYLVLLLERIRVVIPPGKRRKFMNSIGYDYHPAMPDGRANNPILPDGVKSRLYVRRDHLVALNVTSHVAICDAYTAAQTVLPVERVA